MLVPFGCLSVMSLSKLSFQPPKTAIWLSGQSGAGVGTYHQNARKSEGDQGRRCHCLLSFRQAFHLPECPQLCPFELLFLAAKARVQRSPCRSF